MPRLSVSERKALIRDLKLLAVTDLTMSLSHRDRFPDGTRIPNGTRERASWMSVLVLMVYNNAGASSELLLMQVLLCILQRLSYTRLHLNSRRRREWNIRISHLQVLGIFQLIKQLRRRRGSHIPKPPRESLGRTYITLLDRPQVFLEWARMPHQSFRRLVGEIRTHPDFSSKPNHIQTPCEMQLVVALAYMGMSGHFSISAHKLSQIFNIDEERIEEYTEICIGAIVSLEEKYVKWPTASERVEYVSQSSAGQLFDKAVGLVDGAVFPLAFRPSKDPEQYLTGTKFVYGVNSIIVCNRDRRVMYAVHGRRGGEHDQRVYESSEIYKHPEKWFSPGEYVLADSDLAASATVIPAFKPGSTESTRLPDEQEEFNAELSRQRGEVDECVGMMMKRWQSLHAIPLKLTDAYAAHRLDRWIRACVILHNFLLDHPGSADLALLDAPHPAVSLPPWARPVFNPNQAPTASAHDPSKQLQLLQAFRTPPLSS